MGWIHFDFCNAERYLRLPNILSSQIYCKIPQTVFWLYVIIDCYHTPVYTSHGALARLMTKSFLNLLGIIDRKWEMKDNLGAPFPPYLSFLVHVAFVSQDHFLDVGRGMLLYVSYPVLYVVERFVAGDVVDEEDAHGASVVGSGDGSEPLLTRRVPVAITQIVHKSTPSSSELRRRKPPRANRQWENPFTGGPVRNITGFKSQENMQSSELLNVAWIARQVRGEHLKDMGTTTKIVARSPNDFEPLLCLFMKLLQ